MSDAKTTGKHAVSDLYKKLRGQNNLAVMARGAGGSFFVMVVGAAAAFLSNLILARLMGASQYGVYIYALTWINLLTLICMLGMDTALLRFVAAYSANANWSLLRGILGRSAHYVTLASVVIAICAGAIVWALYGTISEEQAITLWIAILLLPILSLTGLRQSALQGFKHVIQASLPDSLFRPLTIMTLSALYYVSFHQLQAPHVMVINLLGAIVAFSIGSFWLVRALPAELRHSPPLYAEREWIKVSLPLYFMSGMHLILHQTDIIMLGALISAEHAGIYAVASRLAGLAVFGLVAANAIVAPIISELYSTKNLQELQRMIAYSARGIFAFTVAASICLAVLGQFLLNLFGEAFVIGYTPLLILLAGQVINALAGSVGFLMTMTGHQGQAAKILGLSAIINITLNAALIPQYGMTGAAVATAASTAIWNFAMLTYVWRRMNINPTVLARIQ